MKVYQYNPWLAYRQSGQCFGITSTGLRCRRTVNGRHLFCPDHRNQWGRNDAEFRKLFDLSKRREDADSPN